MMHRLRLLSLALLLPLLAAAGCRRGDGPETEEETKLGISIYIPSPAQTRADEGSVASETAAEDAIHDLQIWVFLSEACAGHPAGYCLGYLAPSPLSFASAFQTRYYLSLEKAVAKAKPRLDVYALANAASAGYDGLDRNTTASELDALVLQGGVFGIDNGAPVQTSVPDGGFPFSGVGKNMEMSGKYPVLSVDVVTLRRSVSKLRFVFSQLEDEEGLFNDYAVTGIQVDGERIAAREYLFNDSANAWKMDPMAGYTASGFSMALPASLAQCRMPEKYAFSGQDAATYQALINEGLLSGELSSGGVCYLRESDRKLSGTIRYTIGGVPGEVPFEMKNAGDFARNHTWIVYLYFTADAIDFSVSWTLWEEGHDFNLTD